MGLMTRLVVVNPATEEVLAELPQSTIEEIRATIDKAYDAFLKWSETPLKTRAKLLLKAAELLEAAGEELVKTLVAESGKPIKDAEVELMRTVSIVRARFENARQNCNATKRAFVQRSVYDKMVKTMEKAVAEAREKGEGAHRRREAGQEGLLLRPHCDRLRRRRGDLRPEVFGPVLPVVPFDAEEEAVALANATKYGLQAAVYTRDYRMAMRVARAIKAGSVMINDSTRVRFDALPYGGVKMSGLAWREGVRSTMLYFTEPKF